MTGFLSLCLSFPRAKFPQEDICTIESWRDTHKRSVCFKSINGLLNSLNSLCDLTSAADVVNILLIEGSKLLPIYLCTLIRDKLNQDQDFLDWSKLGGHYTCKHLYFYTLICESLFFWVLLLMLSKLRTKSRVTCILQTNFKANRIVH